MVVLRARQRKGCSAHALVGAAEADAPKKITKEALREKRLQQRLSAPAGKVCNRFRLSTDEGKVTIWIRMERSTRKQACSLLCFKK